MAAATDVSFDVLLGGKVTPQLLKSFKDLEDMMKKQGATAKTINAIMGKAYKETFDDTAKVAKEDFGKVEKSARETFNKVAEQAREAQHKVTEAFDKIKESMAGLKESAAKLFEFTGVSALVGAVGGAITIEELIKKGIEVHRERATEQEVLAATLRGRGRGLETGAYAEAAERLAAQANIGHKEAMEMMTKLAASGRFRSPEQAQAMAMNLIGLGGGTAEGAQANLAMYQRMLMQGRLNPRMIARLGAGSGINILQQLSSDTGIPVADLQKQFAEAKVSKKTGAITGGALAGAKGIEALNKALTELGQSRGIELINAHMKGMEGLFYRFGEHWEDFTDRIGEFVEKVISPLGDEINKVIDSVDWAHFFDPMIEKGKEWGQMIKAVWDTIANSPVLTRIKLMWEDFWRSFTGGVDLYGPRVAIRNVAGDIALKHGYHMGRQMTEAGKEWVKATSERVENFIKGIVDAFSWFKDHWKEVADGLWKIVEAFLAIKALEVANQVLAFSGAVWGLVTATHTAAMAIGTAEGVGLVASLGALGLEITAITGLIGLLVSTTSKDPVLNKLADLQAQRGAIDETWAAKQSALSEQLTAGAITPEQYKAQLKDLQDAHEREVKALDAQIKTQQDQADANKKAADAAKALDDQLHKTTGNDLVHFAAAIDTATAGLLNFENMMSQAGSAGFGGFGLGSGYGGSVTGAHFTEYGPSVDPIGSKDYDYNSYHHIGAWPSITGPLRTGDVALGYLSQAKYHVSPGQIFTDEYGRTWRFADRSGSKDPYNVDVFKGAMGGIFRRPTNALIGESGPEAVIPLSGAGAAAAGLGNVTINVNVSGNADDPERIAEAVQRVIQQHWRRSAVV